MRQGLADPRRTPRWIGRPGWKNLSYFYVVSLLFVLTYYFLPGIGGAARGIILLCCSEIPACL